MSYEKISPSVPAFATVYRGGATDVRTSGADVWKLESLADLAEHLRRPPVRTKEKASTPLLVRARSVGSGRKKRDLAPPYLVVLDVDASEQSIGQTHERLKMLDVAHIAHTTWSHSGGRRHSYRVYTDLTCSSWDAVRAATARLQKLAGVGERESATTLGLYVPAVHPDRQRAYRFRDELEGSAWWRDLPEPGAKVRARSRPSESEEVVDIDELRSALAKINNVERATWIAVGMALRSSGLPDDVARELWDEWSRSQGYPDYSDDAQEERWLSFDPDREDGVGVRTIFHLARHGGWRPPRERAAARDDFAEFLPAPCKSEAPALPLVQRRATPRLETGARGAILRNVGNAARCLAAMDLGLSHDELADRVMMLGAGYEAVRVLFPTVSRHLDDHALSALVWMLREGHRQIPGVEFSVDVLQRTALTLALNKSFNPVVSWLQSLEWDGKERIETWLADYAGADDAPLVRAAGRVLLVGAVARAMVPGIKLDLMVVLEGAQGAGKSSLVTLLGGEYALEGLPTSDLRDKDVVTAMLGKWFVELDELDVARKADAQSLKSFLSRTTDRVRLAYAKETRDFPRRCVFVGTTNDAAYLKDSTGNRRFLPVQVGRIDLKAVARDREQLFAEATRAWSVDPRPEALVMPTGLWREAAEQAEARRLADPWEEVIEDFVRADPRRILRGIEILEGALEKAPGAQRLDDLRRVKTAMMRLNWEYGRFRRKREGQQGGAGELIRGFKRPDHASQS